MGELVTEFYRKDKRVTCQKCYHSFWQDASLPKRFYQCPRCGHDKIDIVKEYGKPVIELRKYQIFSDGQ